MKQDEEGWTEKAAGLLGCRCVSSCGPGSPGQACQQREATWGGVQKSGGLGRGGACQEATRDCPTPPPPPASRGLGQESFCPVLLVPAEGRRCVT